MKQIFEETRYMPANSGISKNLEKQFRKDKENGHHEAREASAEFYQRIVEDLTGLEVATIYYDRNKEKFKFVFKERYAGDLVIDVAFDLLSVCTCDVIRQTQAHVERMKEKQKG